ncbi:FUSC family protein [Nocardioides jensenii]|uniref:FUSC family protein n=1 Tax=Nocardioides jensenii TaxID=1843 RepID=UPI001FE043EE|nr:FUSC family protein [Nocardioides jensenii]
MILHRDLTRSALRVGPHNGAHRVALRAGLSVLVPLLVLWSMGHLDWSIYAAFGAFTSLYGRQRGGRGRAQLQVTLAVALTASVALGVVVGISPHRAWLAVPVAGLVAGIGSWFSDLEDWHPPGPLFMIFAFAAVASIPAQVEDLGAAVLVAGGSALFAVGVGSAGSAWRAVRRPSGRASAWHPRHPSAARRHVARSVIGVLVAGAVATGIGIGHPYWAMVSAVVPLAAKDLFPQLVRGLQRVVGTGLGLLTAGLLLALEPRGLVLILVVVVLQVGAELLVGRNYALALVVITPLALLMVHLAAPTPTRTLLFDRGVETVIGVVIGILTGYLTRDRSRA